MGGPKALVRLDGRPLALRAVDVLRAAGCAPVVVVVGAAADEVRALLPADVTAVEAEGWADGMGASLRAGLAALEPLTDIDAVVVHLVDLPGVTAAAVARLAAASRDEPRALIRASYDGRAGHPVVLGRDHWAAVAGSATGDAGARGYLAGNPDVVLVECGDVAEPDDVDTPEQLARRAGDA
ncbi:MAG: molybdopterin-guanine dinucleotide biosynthesis protein MobA [Pseudonocardia sp. SCN 73-27]|nr:MAG: molybdopterin-guanine dinucleotide biosynthesis protein MobA [Pseudonocardia sp. SCN 72-51]ODV02608.1 MAG: molybdopterin-guanine dinucleotide biosynthesis protein MobA [Pseudonocardia sp. SCN 73-27]